MPNKKRERFYIDKLRDCLSDLPAGEPIAGESPDFRIGVEESSLGLEVTAFYHPPPAGERPHQEIQALKDRVVDIAERHHAEAGGPPLYVDAIFNDRRPLTKRNVPEVALSLAQAVLLQEIPLPSPQAGIDIPHVLLPDEVPHVRLYRSVDGIDKLWQADAGGWVQQIHSQHIQSLVDGKMRKFALARGRCGRLWLVIAHDILAGAAVAEITQEALRATYRHSFDRVLWLDPHIPRATDLLCSELK